MSNNKIKIALLDISPQNKAILEFYFEIAGKSLYTVVNEDNATAFIIDYDQYGAKDRLPELLALKKPILLISIKEQDIASTIWLAKPLSADALNKAAEKVHKMSAELEATIESNQEFEVIEAEVEVAEVETATEVVVEKEELVVDESLGEVSLNEETLSIETLAKSAQESSETAKEEPKQENSFLDAGLAIAGTSALASASLGFSKDSDDEISVLDEVEDKTDEIDLIDFDSKDSELDDSNLTFNVDLEDDDKIETADEDVDSLLDSLLEEDENSLVEENTTDDTFADNLLIDEDIDLDLNDETSDENLDLDVEIDSVENDFDVLESVDSELESNFDLIGSTDQINEIETLENDQVSSELIDESFTILDETEQTTEEVFADDIELSISNDNELQVEETETPEIGLQLDPEENKTPDQSFLGLDLETENTNKDAIEIAEESINEPEISLLNEVGTDAELNIPEEVNTDLGLDIIDETDDLDSLLKEISEDNETGIPAAEFPEVVDFEDLETVSDSDATEAITEISLFEDELSSDSLTEENLFDDSSLEDSLTEDSLIEDNMLGGLAAGAVAAGGLAASGLATSVLKEDDSDDFSDADLQSLLNEVREEAGNTGKQANGQGLDNTVSEKRWMQLCGNLEDVKAQKEVSKIAFDPSKHMLAPVLEQIKLSAKSDNQLFQVKYEELIIVIDHSQDTIYCNLLLTDDEYSIVCFNEIDPKKLKIHDLDYSEVKLYRSKIEKNLQNSHSIESFIWATSLLTSRGRLPKDTNVNKVVALKYWPNMSRMEQTPNAMNLAAVFSKHPGNLLEIADWLKIQQKYVFAFYNAALSLDMIDFNARKQKKSRSIFGRKKSAKDNEQRGFFGRLLKRLK